MQWTPLELDAIESIKDLVEKGDWSQAISKIMEGGWSTYIINRVLTGLGYVYDPYKFRIIYSLSGGVYYLFLPKDLVPDDVLGPYVAVIGVDTKNPCEKEGRQSLSKIIRGLGIGPVDMDEIYLEVVKKAQWRGAR